MDYSYIESLLLSTKNGDLSSKEKLIEEFNPFIRNLSRKTFIPGYTEEDVKEECLLSLLKAIQNYNPNKHRFVAYATNAIKNNLNYLIRTTVTHKKINGPDALSFTGSLEEFNLHANNKTDTSILDQHDKRIIRQAVNKCLTDEQKELFIFAQLKSNTLKEYASLKNITYAAASTRKQKILQTLTKYFMMKIIKHKIKRMLKVLSILLIEP